MQRSTRRGFLKEAGIGASVIAGSGMPHTMWADETRPRAPFKTRDSNDKSFLAVNNAPGRAQQ